MEKLICICDGIGVVVLFEGVLVVQLLVDFSTIMMVVTLEEEGS